LASAIAEKQIAKPSFIAALIASTKPNYIKKIIDFVVMVQFSNLSKLLFRHQFFSQRRQKLEH